MARHNRTYSSDLTSQPCVLFTLTWCISLKKNLGWNQFRLVLSHLITFPSQQMVDYLKFLYIRDEDLVGKSRAMYIFFPSVWLFWAKQVFFATGWLGTVYVGILRELSSRRINTSLQCPLFITTRSHIPTETVLWSSSNNITPLKG